MSKLLSNLDGHFSLSKTSPRSHCFVKRLSRVCGKSSSSSSSLSSSLSFSFLWRSTFSVSTACLLVVAMDGAGGLGHASLCLLSFLEFGNLNFKLSNLLLLLLEANSSRFSFLIESFLSDLIAWSLSKKFVFINKFFVVGSFKSDRMLEEDELSVDDVELAS